MNQKRRDILKLLGAAPITAQPAAAMLKEIAANPVVKTAADVAGLGAPVSFSMKDRIKGSVIANTLGIDIAEEAARALDDERYSDNHFQHDLDRIDYDIAAIKSTSIAYKISIQRTRNAEERQFNILMGRLLNW